MSTTCRACSAVTGVARSSRGLRPPPRRRPRRGRHQSRPAGWCCRPLGPDRSPEEGSLRDADAGQGRDPARRAEHARQLVQGIHGHVVHRAAPGLAEIPRRVDGTAGGAGPFRLLLVIPLEGCTADRPDDPPDRTIGDELPRSLDLRAKHLAGRSDDTEPAGRGERDELVCFGDGRACRRPAPRGRDRNADRSG